MAASAETRDVQPGDLMTIEYTDEIVTSIIREIDTSDPAVLNILVGSYLVNSNEHRHYVIIRSGHYVIEDSDYEGTYYNVTFRKAPEIYENNAADNFLRMIMENTILDITLGLRKAFRENWSPWIRGREGLDGIINDGVGYWKKLLFDPETQQMVQRVLHLTDSAASPAGSPLLSPHLVQRPAIQYDPIDINRLSLYYDDIMGREIGEGMWRTGKAVKFARRYEDIREEYNRLLRTITKPAGRLG